MKKIDDAIYAKARIDFIKYLRVVEILNGKLPIETYHDDIFDDESYEDLNYKSFNDFKKALDN